MNIKDEEKSDIVKDNIQNESIQPERNQDTSFSFNQLLKDAGRQSLKVIKWFVIVMLSFGLPNLIFFIIALIKYGNRPLNESSLGLLGILFIGIVSTVIALIFTQKYLLIDTLNVVYKYLTPLFKRICLKIIDKVISGGNNLPGNQDIEKSLNVGSLMIEVYGKKLPNYVRKSVVFILKRVPFSSFLFNMHDDLKSGRKDRTTLSEMLYNQLDTFIINTFFKDNSMKWILWLLPLDIIIQIILLIYFK